jgi:hypothetical protein
MKGAEFVAVTTTGISENKKIISMSPYGWKRRLKKKFCDLSSRFQTMRAKFQSVKSL